MAHLTPRPQNRIRRSLLFIGVVALMLAPGAARSQQSAAHTWHPSPIVNSVRPTVVRVPVRTSVAWPASGERFASTPRALRIVQPARILTMRSSLRPISGAPIFFRPFSFGAGFAGGFGFGYAGPGSQSGEVPLGFGLWPACDSANIPGVFWSVGPCFGIGDYSASAAAAGSAYSPGSAPPATFLLPLFFAEEPQSTAAPQQNPGAAAPAATMLLYLTDGSTIAASDWWVARGRLQYITTAGTTGSMDLSQLDLEQTIKQNETRGLEFHLKFTAPADRP